jgi:hypothetical protein
LKKKLKKFKPEFSNGRSAQAVVLTANGSVPTGIVPMAFLAVPAPLSASYSDILGRIRKS